MEKSVKVFLLFPKEKVGKPVAYHLVKDYDIVFNILHAEINNTRGELTVELTGTEDNLEKGLEFIREQGVEVRLFPQSIIRDEKRCVHCGACTGLCPTQALNMDTDTWLLGFDPDKCIVCEQCVSACPVGAIDVSIFE
jgi:L-aspartate semialdehyde sulfurtransferase ferredoxin